jgi:hypothetical protein
MRPRPGRRLRKYGKVLQHPQLPKFQARPAIDRPGLLPPIHMGRHGTGQPALFQAKGPIQSFPMKGAQPNPDRRHNPRIPYRPVLPTLLPPLGQALPLPGDGQGLEGGGQQLPGSGRPSKAASPEPPQQQQQGAGVFGPPGQLRGGGAHVQLEPLDHLAAAGGAGGAGPGRGLGGPNLSPARLEEISPKNQYHARPPRDMQVGRRGGRTGGRTGGAGAGAWREGGGWGG